MDYEEVFSFLADYVADIKGHICPVCANSFNEYEDVVKNDGNPCSAGFDGTKRTKRCDGFKHK